MSDCIVYRRPVFDGILIDPAFDGTGLEWAMLSASIWCGVPRWA